MEIKTNYLDVIKQARYSVYGELSERTKYFWFVLHGSKMKCEQMLYKFSSFDPETHVVIAPEGLSRFYLNGFGGEVVSSWMTTRDRINEIDDLSNYLSKLYYRYTERLPKHTVKSILGFSQGGTIMFRWLNRKLVNFNHLIAYSCWFPEDIRLDNSKSNVTIPIYYTFGERDQYLTPSRMAAMKEVIVKNGLDVKFLPYDGDHRVSRSQIETIFDLIKK